MEWKLEDETLLGEPATKLVLEASQLPYTLWTEADLNPNWIDPTTQRWSKNYLNWNMFKPSTIASDNMEGSIEETDEFCDFSQTACYDAAWYMLEE